MAVLVVCWPFSISCASRCGVFFRVLWCQSAGQLLSPHLPAYILEEGEGLRLAVTASQPSCLSRLSPIGDWSIEQRFRGGRSQRLCLSTRLDGNVRAGHLGMGEAMLYLPGRSCVRSDHLLSAR